MTANPWIFHRGFERAHSAAAFDGLDQLPDSPGQMLGQLLNTMLESLDLSAPTPPNAWPSSTPLDPLITPGFHCITFQGIHRGLDTGESTGEITGESPTRAPRETEVESSGELPTAGASGVRTGENNGGDGGLGPALRIKMHGIKPEVITSRFF